MNYDDHSEITNYLRSMERYVGNTYNKYLFNSVNVNGFEVSFCAGDMANCKPRGQYPRLLDYKEIQMAIDELIGPQDYATLREAICPLKDSRFASFDWAKSYFTYTDVKGVVKARYMGECVPIGKVPEIIHDVYRISRLRAFH